MTRTRAALLHLIASAMVVGTVLVIVFFVWYPGFLFTMSGTILPVLVMISVDVTLGPFLTFIVYKPGKWGLKFDMAFIVTVQIIALGYGALTLFNERPHFLVFAQESFTAVSAQQVDMDALRYDELRNKPLVGPVLAFARMPEDRAERNRLVESVLFEGQPDIERRAEFFEPFANGLDVVRAAARPLDRVEPSTPEERQALLRLSERYAGQAILLVPARSFRGDFSVVVDGKSLEPIDLVRINLWDRTGD